MPSTSVHLPESLLEGLTHLAAERGVSRNRLIVEACRNALRSRRAWPADFFSNARFDPEELEALRAGAEDFQAELDTARRSREEPPF